MGDEKTLTTGEVARRCGVSLPTVRMWIESGLLEAYRLPGKQSHHRVTSESLRRFLEENDMPMFGGAKK